jgi:hypothetical protein
LGFYTSSAFEACALMCRRSLKRSAGRKASKAGNLDSKLKKLAEQRVIDALSYDALNETQGSLSSAS